MLIDTKYKSFLKQMSVYGFEKLGERNDWCFYHTHFHKDFPDSLIYITRVKSSEEPSYDALERKKFYQAMLSEGNANMSTNEKDDSFTVDSNVSVERNEENTMKLLQSPQFILNALTPHVVSPCPPPYYYDSMFPVANYYPNYYQNYYYYTPMIRY